MRRAHLLFALGLSACSLSCNEVSSVLGMGEPAASASAGPKKAPSFPVEVAPVGVERVDYLITSVGSIEPSDRGDVTARVAGVVDRVRFREGDTVKAGALLVDIEPGRYSLAAEQARASRTRADAAKADAKTNLDRRESLVKDGLASVEELESARTKLAVAEAEYALAKASYGLTQLNLHDAYVRTPEAGVIQTRSVHVGKYVQPGTVLATLIRRDPLRLRFTVSENEARSVTTKMSARFTVRGDPKERTASITYVAASASDSTRTVEIIATVDEADETLRPGTFAEVSIIVGGREAAPVIPQMAARPTAKGFVAYVVEDGVAKERGLTLGMRTVDGRAEVKEGLVAGEKLVIRGGEALRDGASVRVAPPSAAGSAAPSVAPATSSAPRPSP